MEWLPFLAIGVPVVVALVGFMYKEVFNRRIDFLEKNRELHQQEIKILREDLNNVKQSYVTKSDMRDMKNEILDRIDERFDSLKEVLKK